MIEDVTVISPEREQPLRHADVVLRNGRIAQIAADRVAGPHVRRLDGRGRFLIPGLIDSHVHVGHQGPLDDDAIAAHPELLAAYRGQLPRAYLAFGFTTLVDLDLAPGTHGWFDAAPVHPRLYHCGRAVRIAGGYGAQRAPTDPAKAAAVNLIHEPAQAERWPASLDPRDHTPARAVDRVLAAGGICLKVFVEPGFGGAFHWPVPRPETLAALRDEAHRRGLVLVVHANATDSRREIQRWVEAGAPLPVILRAATLDNAAAFGLAAQLGSIEVGKRADLLLLRADPLETAGAYDAIDTVIVNGEPIARATLVPAR